MNQNLIGTTHHSSDSNDVFGFWLYIMSDCLIFASLFATYIVLHREGVFVPSLSSLIDLPYVFAETLFLLVSNFTFGMAILSMYKNKVWGVRAWLMLTFILGAYFVGMEVMEFIHFYHAGYNFHQSGSASAFYVLVGTHGFHVLMGLLWILVMVLQFFVFGISETTKRRTTYLGLFWNFLDIVWIFVFTVVYLMGAM